MKKNIESNFKKSGLERIIAIAGLIVSSLGVILTIFLSDNIILITFFLSILLLTLIFILSRYIQHKFFSSLEEFEQHTEEKINKIITKAISDTKLRIADISSINKLRDNFEDIDQEIGKILGYTDFINNQRKKLWEEYRNTTDKDPNSNNLLKSLVYPSTSLYSVTAFVIGLDSKSGAPRAMLLMRSKYKNGREQEYDVLGQRMPNNALPHYYAKNLICKYVFSYSEKDIVFSDKFHDSIKYKEYEINPEVDSFTKQVPRPFRVQEESNPQSDGSPFFLDFIYVLEVKMLGPNGVLQSDLKAEWVPLETVIDICKNDASPERYGKGTFAPDKMYMKYESQRVYAEIIAKKYLGELKTKNT